MNNANAENLKIRIIDNVTGYVTVKAGDWTFAFTAKNDRGYVNVKVKMTGFERFVTFGYLDVSEWQLRATRFCEVRDPDKVDAAKATARDMFAGRIAFEDAPNPRGKPPGQGAKSSAPRKGGGRKSGDQKVSAELEEIAAELVRLRQELETVKASEAMARENLRRVLNGEKLETGMTVSSGPAATGDGAITLRNRAAALLRSAISHCEMGEERAALAALTALNRIRKGA